MKMPVPTESTDGSSCAMSSSIDEDCTLENMQNMVLVQVNPGETFTIQREDGSCKNISGPAQVPMISHNGAIPPIYVPPGYMSQVVEENGVRHVIVSPSPGMDGPPTYMGMPTIHHPHPQIPVHGVQQTHIFPGMYPQNMMPNCRLEEAIPYSPLPMFVPEEMYFPDLSESSLSSMHQSLHAITPPSEMFNNVSPQPHLSGQHEHLPKKLQDDPATSQQLSSDSAFSTSSMTSSPASTSSFASSPSGSPKAFRNSLHSNGYHPPKSPVKLELLSHPSLSVPSNVNVLNPNSHCYQAPEPHTADALAKSADAAVGQSSADTRCYQTITELLAAIRKPEVYDVEDRSATIVWGPLPVQKASSELQNDVREFAVAYELHFSRSRKDIEKFRCVYSGKEPTYTFRDLRPASDYIVKLYAVCNYERSQPTEAAAFRTLSSVPDAPAPPKLQSRTKNSLQLKWTTPYENGERIQKYYLEIDEAKHGNGFRPLSSVSQKLFKVTKLQPAHAYQFRLAAENKLGKSAWSIVVCYETSGLVPSVPEPPRLTRALVKSLSLSWLKPQGEVTGYALEMDDESSGYGFRPVYDGMELKFVVKNLDRASRYKFRLLAYNSEGKSKHSETVFFFTRPDKPRAPNKPHIKGNVHARFFKLCWDGPADSGGAAVNEYTVEMSEDPGQSLRPIFSGLEQECQVDDLNPGHTYRLRVSCRTNGGVSPPSEVLQVATPPVLPGPCNPLMLAMRPKPTCLILKWDPPPFTGGAAIDRYELNYILMAELGSSQPSQAYKGTGLECAVGDLLPGTKYSFAVRAANIVGFGPWSDRLEAVTSPGVPAKPAAPEATVLNPTLIHLQWTAPECNGAEITNYRLQWSRASDAMSVEETGPVLVHELKCLKANATHYYTIQAINRVGAGPCSDVGCVITPPSCPSPVEHLRLCDVSDEATIPYAVTASQIAIRWDRPDDNGSDITGYKIHVCRTRPTTGNNDLYEVDGASIHHLIEDLESDTEYSIKVCATNEIGCGCFSHSLKVRTKSLPPDAPELTCVHMTSSSLKLKWKNRSKVTEGTHYLLQRRDKHGRFITQYKGSDLSYKVSKLSENSAYQFRINASNAEGVGHFSQEYSFSTQPQLPPALEAPVISEVQATLCHVTWQKLDPIKGDAVHYRLSLGKPNDPGFSVNFTRDSSSHTLDRLSPNTVYNIRVTALRRRSSSVRYSHLPPRDDSSTCSEATDDGQEADLSGPPGYSATFRTPPSDREHGPMEKPRLLLRPSSAPATSDTASKLSETSKRIPLPSEDPSQATVSESSSETTTIFAVMMIYLLSAILIAYCLQLLFAV